MAFPVNPSSKLFRFTSEDSQDTDESMNSSLEIAETNAQNNVANKFNQLRETMNKYFQANPELAAAIRFEEYEAPEPTTTHKQQYGHKDHGSYSPVGPGSPVSKFNNVLVESARGNKGSGLKLKEKEEDAPKALVGSSAKLWDDLSREMNRIQKHTKMPTQGQMSHMLNLFKKDFEKPDVLDGIMTSQKALQSPRKAVVEKPQTDFRITTTRTLSAEKKRANKEAKNKTEGSQEEEEDGVMYFSFRKKMHLQLKHKRREEEERNKELRILEEEERARRAKEMEERARNSLDDLDYDNRKQPLQGQDDAVQGSMKNFARKNRRNSTKQTTKIFDRLANTNRDTVDENKGQDKPAFTSPIAEALYDELKAGGYSESFKKMANAQLALYKKEFKDKMSKQKTLPVEGLKFTKEGNKHFNTFLPDFEKAAHVQNKNAVFQHNEVIRGSEEWRENPENDVLARLNKIASGTFFEFWRDAKELNQ